MKKLDLTSKEFEQLFAGILKLKNRAECRAFFRDLNTPAELTAMAERFQIALLLDAGKSYREIAAELSVSTTTVTRVAQWLHRGRGGYHMVIKRLRQD